LKETFIADETIRDMAEAMHGLSVVPSGVNHLGDKIDHIRNNLGSKIDGLGIQLNKLNKLDKLDKLDTLCEHLTTLVFALNNQNGLR